MPSFVISEKQRVLIDAMIPLLPVYRKQMRMSQADFGAAIGKSRQKISEVERGAAPLGWDSYLATVLILSAHGVLEPFGRDAAMFADIERIVGGRFRFC